MHRHSTRHFVLRNALCMLSALLVLSTAGCSSRRTQPQVTTAIREGRQEQVRWWLQHGNATPVQVACAIITTDNRSSDALLEEALMRIREPGDKYMVLVWMDSSKRVFRSRSVVHWSETSHETIYGFPTHGFPMGTPMGRISDYAKELLQRWETMEKSSAVHRGFSHREAE